MPKEDAILSKKNKENTIPSSPKVPDTFSPNKNSAPCEVKLDKAVQSICSAKHKKKRTHSLDPKKGFAAFRRRALKREWGLQMSSHKQGKNVLRTRAGTMESAKTVGRLSE